MENNNLSFSEEDFQYGYVYSLLKNYFKFNEKENEDFIKDVIKVLIEFEKIGETIIDIDKRGISFDLLKKGWPEKHISVLKETGLIGKKYSPIILENRKISWVKWFKRLDSIKTLINEKSNINEIEKNHKREINKNEDINLINKILDISNIVLLQGGPGTGKSTLIIETIFSFLKNDKTLNIGLAAPTGKASSRLRESLMKNKNRSNNMLDRIECQTLHKWLYNSLSKNRKLKFNLKELDLLIIDEMSMVGIDMIQSVFDSLSNDCIIILVGDMNQLPPINNCSIWNDIFENNQDRYEDITINLKKVFRNSGDILKLSNLISASNYKSFNSNLKELINKRVDSNINFFRNNTNKIPDDLIKEIKLFLKDLNQTTSKLSFKKYIFSDNNEDLLLREKDLVLDILNKLNSTIILCEKNIGIWGVENINNKILEQEPPYDFYSMSEGIPIMCIENNDELGISNGDIGVTIGKKNNRRLLFRRFNDDNQPIISLINPSNLENVVPAIAITIHKSQGSEASTVNLLWSKNNHDDSKDYMNSLFSFKDNYQKRLLYTAITRAKENLNIYLME